MRLKTKAGIKAWLNEFAEVLAKDPHKALEALNAINISTLKHMREEYGVGPDMAYSIGPDGSVRHNPDIGGGPIPPREEMN